MTTATATATKTKFILCYQAPHGGWMVIGYIWLGKRLQPEESIKRYFGYNLAYRSALKSCRYLAAESAAVSVEWEVEKGFKKGIRFATFKIKPES